MPVEIENLTNKPVLLGLNSNNTMHLAPCTTSTQILAWKLSYNS